MWHRHLSRRRFLVLGGTGLLSAGLWGRSAAQTSTVGPIRVGVVIPTRTGSLSIDAALYDFVGEAARMGSIFAEDQIGDQAELQGLNLEVLLASSPSAEAAFRAGQRLVATEGICALIGGLGEGQAEALSVVAQERRLPFFNIGSPSNALREERCNPYVFHIEASAAMYLDAIVMWHAQEERRWFVIYEDSDGGVALQRQALQSISKHAPGGKVTGMSSVLPEQPAYLSEFNAIRDTKAEIILLLVNARDQVAFLSQYETTKLEAPVAAFPDPVTQTRDYYGAVAFQAPRFGSGHRVSLWDTTLNAHGAGELNDQFMSRWGTVMDPPAWAAYQAIKIVFEAIVATESLDADRIIEHLESPQTVFDVQKGTQVSFRPWDHQLRQPLYVVKIDSSAEYGISLAQQIALASVIEEVPSTYRSNTSTLEQLDLLGTGLNASRCQF